MLKRTSNKLLAFNNGVCSIWTIEKNHFKNKLGDFDFHEDTVGIKSFSELGLQGKQIDKVISIPYQGLIDYSYAVVIENKAYSIALIQKKDTFPKSLKLTLEKSPIKMGEQQ